MSNITEQLLKAALAELSTAARKRLLAPYTERRFGMRNSETPGHAYWYPEHRQDECSAARLLGLPVPKVGPDPLKLAEQRVELADAGVGVEAELLRDARATVAAAPKKRARKIEIDAGPYVRAHGKRPRGRGGWAFAANGRDGIDELIWANGLYRDAVREAKSKAPEGTVVLAVQS